MLKIKISNLKTALRVHFHAKLECYLSHEIFKYFKFFLMNIFDKGVLV